MWREISRIIKGIFSVGSGIHKEKRLDFVAVSEQWERIVARLEARIVLVESELAKCQEHHRLANLRVNELERELLRIGYVKHLSMELSEKRIEPQSTIRVLVVDDEKIMRQCVMVLMEAEGESQNIGVDFTEASDGEQCMDALGQHDFNAVMLDLNMPRVNGWDVIRKMKAMTKRPLVFVITGYFRHYPEIEALLVSGEVTMVLEKPIDMASVASVFDKIKENM